MDARVLLKISQDRTKWQHENASNSQNEHDRRMCKVEWHTHAKYLDNVQNPALNAENPNNAVCNEYK
jgi:CRISPR/Cas system type I-B associated protein Csh2 (Cas7 group RAMP superfamily)